MADSWQTLLTQADAALTADALSTAAALYDQALARDLPPEARAAAHNNRALIHEAQGEADEAWAHLTAALAVMPDDPHAVANGSRLALAAGQVAAAEALARRALTTDPGNLDVACDGAVALLMHDRVTEALELLTPWVAEPPSHARLTLILSDIFRTTGAPARALAVAEALVATHPDLPAAHDSHGLALCATGQPLAGAAAHRRALALTPDQPHLLVHLGQALAQAHEVHAARECFDQALAVAPGYGEALAERGRLWLRRGMWSRAAEDLAGAAAAEPDRPLLQRNLGTALAELRRTDEAWAALERASALGHTHADSVRAFYEIYAPDATARSVATSHQRAAARIAGGVRPQPLAARDLAPPLRVGYLSPDMRYQAVGWLVGPLFRHHDPARVSVHVFDYTLESDRYTETVLRPATAQWTVLRDLNDAEAVVRLREARLDVVVDLAGHGRDNRLGLLAGRVAPVQATWLGYPGPTGLAAMDYWITDRVLHPQPGPAAVAVPEAPERVWRLDRCWLSVPAPENLPPVVARPADASPVFGFLGTMRKIHAPTLALWARVLHAVPEARLLVDLPEAEDPVPAGWLRDTLAGHGVAPERLMLESTRGHAHVLARYGEVDVMLDSVPATGGTATTEALWMGVPVVTLAGGLAVHRQSASLLIHAGLGQWVARDAAEYVALARDLVADRAALARWRQALRPLFAASPVADGAAHARAMEDAYMAMVAAARTP